jgi:hypothetical protein
MNILIALLVLALSVFAPCSVQPTMHQRAVTFCEVYGRSVDCAAWVQGAMTTVYELVEECHTTYPPGQDVQFMTCLEEYGM